MLYGARYLCSWQKLQKCGYNLVIMEAAKKLITQTDTALEEEKQYHHYRQIMDEIIKDSPLDHLSAEEKKEHIRKMELACRVMAEHDGVLKRLAE